VKFGASEVHTFHKIMTMTYTTNESNFK